MNDTFNTQLQRLNRFFEPLFPLKLEKQSVLKAARQFAWYSLVIGVLVFLTFLFRPQFFVAASKAGLSVDTQRIQNAAANLPLLFDTPCEFPVVSGDPAPNLGAPNGLPELSMGVPAAAVAAPIISSNLATSGDRGTGGLLPQPAEDDALAAQMQSYICHVTITGYAP